MNTKVNKKNQEKKTTLVGIVTDDKAIELPNKPSFESLEQARIFAEKIATLNKQYSSIKSNLEFLKQVTKDSLEALKLGSDISEYCILVAKTDEVKGFLNYSRKENDHTIIKKQEVVNQFSFFVSGVLEQYLTDIENEILNLQK